MAKTKKDSLTNIILDECNSLANDEITKKDKTMLSDFIKNRLQLHGRNGYVFHDTDGYIPTGDDLSIQRIGFSVLASNHLLNIFNR